MQNDINTTECDEREDDKKKKLNETFHQQMIKNILLPVVVAESLKYEHLYNPTGNR